MSWNSFLVTPYSKGGVAPPGITWASVLAEAFLAFRRGHKSALARNVSIWSGQHVIGSDPGPTYLIAACQAVSHHPVLLYLFLKKEAWLPTQKGSWKERRQENTQLGKIAMSH